MLDQHAQPFMNPDIRGVESIRPLVHSHYSSSGRFQEPLRQVTMPVHGATHDRIGAGHFIEQDVLVEGT
jgi:hypothetical protein